MRRFVLPIAALAVMSGCAADLPRKSAEYGIAFEEVKTQDATFRVYEHPSKKTLAVSSTLAGAAGAGFVKGLTFGIANVLPSQGAYEEAARKYMDKYPALASCRITRGYLLQEPVYEFVFECPG